MRTIIVTFFILLSNHVYAHETIATTLLCFNVEQEKNNASICQELEAKTVLVSAQLGIKETLILMQKTIRKETSKNKTILISEGFTGTLLAIAQTNLLPYYRKNIQGLVLKDAPANLFQDCILNKKNKVPLYCKEFEKFQENLNALASKMETAIALSPALQMDWYWSKTLLLGGKNQETWIEAFHENSLEYQSKKMLTQQDILNAFPKKTSHKVQPKSTKVIPQHYGSLLRFHLNKILYEPKYPQLQYQNISYGTHELQRYDVYLKKSSKNNPLIIYIHGGGWHTGKKENYKDFSRQYADQGFTAVSINYRLLQDSTDTNISMKEMVNDVKDAIEDILNNAKYYGANSKQVVIVSESAGAQLSFLALLKLPKKYSINAAFFNSMVSDLRLLEPNKLKMLSSTMTKEERKQWFFTYSPLNNLVHYRIPTLVTHSLNDNIVSAKNLELLSIYSILYGETIHALWIEDAQHPILPKYKALQPSYGDIDFQVNQFLKRSLVK